MQQYLINTTAIWLMSLVLFEIFLRKESYHGYNRFYLLATFLLGIFIPLQSWDNGSVVYSKAISVPVRQVIAAKQTFMTTTSPSDFYSFDWQFYLILIYLAGVLVGILLLVIEIIKMVKLYRAGKKWHENNFTIIETGKNHGPFSLFHYVFMSSMALYTAEEWQILFAHEQRHGQLLHFIDVFLLQATRIVFWFHPLVYIYQKKLLLVHEFQADKVSGSKPLAYGRFLVEQALLLSTPSITHSFNRSPIKNRIVMLTRKSTAASRIKMLIFIPLALVCMLCFTKNSMSQKVTRNGNMVTFNGNKFEVGKDIFDTVSLTDPVTGNEVVRITKKDPVPLKMNGAKIYKVDELSKEPRFNSKDYSIITYLFKCLGAATGDNSDPKTKLPDGSYNLNIDNIVIGPDGHVVYYTFGGISKAEFSFDYKTPIPEDRKKAIDKRIESILKNATGVPGMVNGKKVPVVINDNRLQKTLEFRTHKK